MFVENCLADNVASVFTRRKSVFLTFFIKEYVGINIENMKKGKIFKVFSIIKMI